MGERVFLIDSQMTYLDAVHALTKGHPGSVGLIGELNRFGARRTIDIMVKLDCLQIHGPEIYVLYVQTCGRDLDRFMDEVDRRWIAACKS
jgi:hypothetical protein